MSAPYPWLADAWRHLLQRKARPDQALLISGPAGVGKSVLARTWAQVLLCESPLADGDACGECGACHWFITGTHPDYRVLTLQEKETKDSEPKLATAIDVDQARDTIDYVQLSTYRAGRRVVVIEPADSLNIAAASALLKVLEEPPLNTCFLLITDHPRRLLPTLRSRCVRLEIGLPPYEQARLWLSEQALDNAPEKLALAGGAPLTALNWQENGELAMRDGVLEGLSRPRSLNPVAQAEAWKTLSPLTWYIFAYKWLCDLLAVRLLCHTRFNPDYQKVLQKLGNDVDLGKLLALSQLHSEQGRYVMHPLNRQLQLEAWLIQYQHIFREEK